MYFGLLFIIYQIDFEIWTTGDQEASQVDSNFQTDSPLSGKHNRIGSKETSQPIIQQFVFFHFLSLVQSLLLFGGLVSHTQRGL